MEDHFHQECYARSCREIEELKRCCYQEENSENNDETWKNFLRSMIRGSPTVSLFFNDSDSPSSYDNTTFLIKRHDMRILGKVLDCQHVRRDPDELHNDSRTLATI